MSTTEALQRLYDYHIKGHRSATLAQLLGEASAALAAAVPSPAVEPVAWMYRLRTHPETTLDLWHAVLDFAKPKWSPHLMKDVVPLYSVLPALETAETASVAGLQHGVGVRSASRLLPTYFVRRPDGSYTEADPQPEPIVMWQCETPPQEYVPPGPLQWEDGAAAAREPSEPYYLDALQGKAHKEVGVARGIKRSQGEVPAEPSAMRLAGLLEAMARNYADGHAWDHLDSATCAEAAAALRTIARLESELAQARAAVPEIDYMAAIAEAYAVLKAPQGTKGCIGFAKGAEWFREIVLSAAPNPPAPARNAELTDEQITLIWHKLPHGPESDIVRFARALLATASSADARDAGRYRKWRDTYASADNTEGVSDADAMLGALANAWAPEAVDEAIDAAIAATKEQPK